MTGAACVGLPTRMFFPEDGDTAMRARKVCKACPVRQECLDGAMARNEDHGVWGGLTVRDRQRLRAKRRVEVPTGFDRATYMREYKRQVRDIGREATMPSTDYGRQLVLLLMEAGAA